VRFVWAWFFRTHEVEVQGFGGAWWKLRHLPESGAIGHQSAWLMSALEHCRNVANAALQDEHDKTDDGRGELRKFHDENRVH
jgi:hypothetical protein